MGSIYIHIPYCKQKCHYCAFHMSTNLKTLNDMIECICEEIKMQKNYLSNKNIETIYFGGGTPSLLSYNALYKIIETIKTYYNINSQNEITIECNIQDLTITKLQQLKELGFNRLSVGIQSFNEKILKKINRHCKKENIYNAISNIKNTHFTNLNLDIIFGIPGQTKKDIENDINDILKIHPQHISVYALTIEKKTFFHHLIQNKQISVNDNIIAEGFMLIDHILTKNNYEHYEISNYCIKGFKSKHNSNYWDIKKQYLGIGPGAHSYNITSRQWNVENNILYINSIKNHKLPITKEILTIEKKRIEYIMLSLRTKEGCNIVTLKNEFKYNIDKEYLYFLHHSNLAKIKNNNIILTPKGMLLADKIIEQIILT